MKDETTQTTETPMADDRVLGEVLINKHPKVLIVGGGDVGIATGVLSQLHKEFGEDLIILTPEQAIEKGIKRQKAFEPEPFILKAHPLIEPITYYEPKNNKPWYSQFDKKRGKRR